MKKNIIFIVVGLNSGGIENYLLRYLQEKHQLYDDIMILCTSGKAGQLEKEYTKIPNVSIVKKKLGYFDFKGYKQLINLFKSFKAHSVCDFSGDLAGIKLKMAQKAGVHSRVAYYARSTFAFREDVFRLKYNAWTHRLVNKYATTIISNSIAAFDFFFQQNWQEDGRFEVVYNGVNVDKFTAVTTHLREELGIPQNAFVVGHTGRYNVAKNHKTIMKVAERLTQQYADAYFIMCGNGVKKNLTPYLKEHQLDESRILLFENRRDIPQFLNTMDCYYFPSITEGQPNALIEAMIMGLPVVTSNIAPMKETTPKGMHPYLVPALDAELAVQRIVEVKTNSELRAKMQCGEWAKNKYEASKQFEKFYNKLKNKG